MQFPSKVHSISNIIKNGQEVPFEVGLNDPNWKRPTYKPYWHSTHHGGRWSFVPMRIHYALHRLFTTYQTGSIWYDFTHNVGLDDVLQRVESSKAFREDRVFEKLVIVVMQAQVEKIIKKDNQLVVVTKPQRNGVQVLTVRSEDIKPTNPKESILVQLVTPKGDELDFTVQWYESPKPIIRE